MNTNNETNHLKDNWDDVDKVSQASSSLVVPGTYYPKNKLHRRKSARKKTKRVVFKNGDFNIEVHTSNNSGYFTTWFITMVEARWRWTFINFFAAFTGDWLFFGFVYWVIALAHGDLSEEHLPHNLNATEWTPCVKNLYGFTSSFLFSVEVHTTVAYGKRAITLECPQSIIAMCLQCILSSIFQAFMIGILFAKLTRPKARRQAILFSKQAAICSRNDQLCLTFRVGDIRKSRILNIKAYLFILRLDVRSEYFDEFEQIELEVTMDGCESTFFLWPVSVMHVIDEKSPLYNISAADILCGKIELLAVFEGMIESTGQPVQARTSYNGNDVLWGHRFVPMVTVKDDLYDVDFSKLCQTEQVDTPLCSANEYDTLILPLSY